MTNTRPIIWEDTPEFKKEKEEAEKRSAEIQDRLWEKGFRSSISMSKFSAADYPQFFLSDQMPLGAKRDCRNYKDALQLARKYGSTRWWGLDELEQFSRGKGIILESAMFELGFRRGKRKEWVRIKKQDETKLPALDELWQKENGIELEPVTDAEKERLKNLLLFPNQPVELNKTYGISVCRRGFIYVCLLVNPFTATRAEDLGTLGELLSSKSHIAKEQQGYTIEAKNIQLGKDNNVIYLRLIRPDKTFVERCWPSLARAENLIKLADSLHINTVAAV